MVKPSLCYSTFPSSPVFSLLTFKQRKPLFNDGSLRSRDRATRGYYSRRKPLHLVASLAKGSSAFGERVGNVILIMLERRLLALEGVLHCAQRSIQSGH